MEVTLRKAAALSQSLLDAARGLQFTKSVNVSIYATKTVAEEIATAQEKLAANISKSTALIAAAFKIRNDIGVENARNGVDKLLTEKGELDATEKLLSTLLSGVISNDYDGVVENESLDIAQARLNALKERYTAPERQYGADYVTVSVIGDELSQQVQDRLSTIRRRKTAIAEQLLTANMTSKVRISAEIEALLNEFKLI